jgi:hypothetical protein
MWLCNMRLWDCVGCELGYGVELCGMRPETLRGMAMKCEGYGCGTVWVGALWYMAMSL